MVLILGKAFSVLAIVLFTPAVLALASQGAVPGDAMYPVKRNLEKGIVVVASVHPQTKAMFYSDLSQRRFKEAMSVIKKGGNGTQSLNELISQTQTAATSVRNVNDEKARKKLAADLIKQIDEYDNGLTSLERDKKVSPSITPTPLVEQPTPQVRTTLAPTPTPVPQQNTAEESDYQRYLQELDRLRKEVEAIKNAQGVTNQATQVAVVAPTSTPFPTATPTPTPIPPTPTLTTGGGWLSLGTPLNVDPSESSSSSSVSPTPTPTSVIKFAGQLIEVVDPTPTVADSLTVTPTGEATVSSVQGISIRWSEMDGLVGIIYRFFSNVLVK